jgi:hypothetical protein
MRKIVPLIASGLAAAAIISGCGSSAPASDAGATGANAPTASAAPGAQSAVLPMDQSPIVNSSTAPGLSIAGALVENNIDPASGKAVDDHLEVTLQNTSKKPLDQLEMYYVISDPATKASEGYYTKLDGVSVPAGGTTVVNFDNTGSPGHFPVNPYSLYYTDKNALVVDVTASAPDVGPATFSVKKDAGGAEAGVE